MSRESVSAATNYPHSYQNHVNGTPQLPVTQFQRSTTLTSTGYGDLLPMHPLVRSLPNLGAVVGQLLSTMLLARIVMLEVQARLSDGGVMATT
jgi:hypothetical protein